jgi:hypothetical protein
MHDLGEISDDALVALYGEVMGELHRRGVVRSGNNPIADIAERVIADFYGVEPQPPNSKSYDVVTRTGKRLQVKALRRTKASRRNLSPLRSLDFDFVVAVVFAVDMQLVEAVFVPIDAVHDHMRWSKTWSANCLSVTDTLLADPRVERLPAEVLVDRRKRARSSRASRTLDPAFQLPPPSP